MPFEIQMLLIVLAIVFVVSFIIKRYQDNKLRKYYRTSIGLLNTRKFEGDHLQKLKFYSEQVQQKDSFYIDNITSHDLDLDNFYNLINTAGSQIGYEYLYSVLRHIKLNEESLSERKKLVDYFKADKEKHAMTLYELSKIKGLPYYLSFYEQIFYLKKEKKSYSHHVQFLVLIITIIVSLINPNIGVPLFGFSLMFNVIRYLVLELSKQSNLNSFMGLVSASDAINRIVKINPDILDNSVAKRVNVFRRGSFVKDGSSTNEFEFLTKIIFYVTHLDFIYYYRMLSHLQNNFQDALDLFEQIGEIETALVIANLHASDINPSHPIFTNTEPLSIKQMRHPLVKDIVANDVHIDESLLVTGSNASGKSTFIKGIAMNIVSSQALLTSFSDGYQGPFYKVLSSMALKDSIESSESYFMVEIRSLNRIVNESQDDVRVIGFIDEILRGTNTIERIAASSAVLQQFIEKNKRFVAATHDIELTKILENEVRNVHFTETLKGDDISFDYEVKDGPSQSRNAIKLLEINGYSSQIIDKANEMVQHFEKEGQWL